MVYFCVLKHQIRFHSDKQFRAISRSANNIGECQTLPHSGAPHKKKNNRRSRATTKPPTRGLLAKIVTKHTTIVVASPRALIRGTGFPL